MIDASFSGKPATPEPRPTGISRRDLLRALAAGTAGALVLPTTFAQQPRKGGRLTIATQSSSTADSLDPARGLLSTDYFRTNLFYNGLTVLDARMTPQLALSEEFSTDDALVWNVKLRQGVEFHDGKNLGAADVVYSLTRHNDPAVGSVVRTVAQQFESVRAIGPLQVEIRLKAANANLPAMLASSNFAIIKADTRQFATANGTGPFRCVEFTPGVRTKAVRNPNYWKPGLPYLDEVALFGIPDESARVNALLSGAVDWINDVNPRSTKRISQEAGYAILETPSDLYTDLIIRQTVGIGRNPDFTLGMKYLIDREQIKRAAFRGYAVIGNDQPISPNNPYYFAGLPQRPYDPERARFHLRKADAVNMTLPVVASVAAAGSVDMAMLLQQSAMKAGLNLRVKRVSADGYWSNHWGKSPIGFGNVNPRPTPDLLFSLFFKSDAPWNASGWKNAQFDQLLLLARAETDEEKRRRYYADMQVLVHQHCGVGIPVFITNLEGYSRRVEGVTSHPMGAFMGYACAERVWLQA